MLHYLVHLSYKGEEDGEEHPFNDAQMAFHYIYTLLLKKQNELDFLGFCIKDEDGSILEKGVYINEWIKEEKE